jgi:hypothetical protein
MRRHALLFLIAAITLAGCQPGGRPSEGSSGQAGPATPTPRKPPAELMGVADPGVQVFLWGEPKTTDRDLQLAKDAGFRWVKQMFQWNFIEGKGKGQFEWHEPDRIVAAVERYGLYLIARLDVAPMWARGPGADPKLHGPPQRMQDFGDFAGAVAARYKGRIQAYQIWNEANLAREWNGKPPNAREYTEMLRVAYEAIKKADPDAIVINGGLSPTTASGAIASPPVQFLREMYAAGAGKYFDMLGAHAAGFKSPPQTDPAVVAKDPVATNHDKSPEVLRRAYAFRYVEDLRQVMIENGDANKRVVILEFGWTTDPRPNSPYYWHRVKEEEKAAYLVTAFQFAERHWAPWIGAMVVIYIAAPHWTPNDEQYYWAITDEDGGNRTSYDAIKDYFTRVKKRP